jgi:hypothetical protein
MAPSRAPCIRTNSNATFAFCCEITTEDVNGDGKLDLDGEVTVKDSALVGTQQIRLTGTRQ